jgi:hypothetical protein
MALLKALCFTVVVLVGKLKHAHLKCSLLSGRDELYKTGIHADG